ncbi:MAG: hypothetical protein RR190_05405 [Bacteroidales bacterium]
MKKISTRLCASFKEFTLIDFAFFKLMLIAIGILVGVYFTRFFSIWLGTVWVIAAVSLVYVITKIIRYMRKNI